MSGRHSWRIKDGVVIYTCPEFVDKYGFPIELEDEIDKSIVCMVCDESIHLRYDPIFKLEKMLDSRRQKEKDRLKEGLFSHVNLQKIPDDK